jgi:hypothetical protein
LAYNVLLALEDTLSALTYDANGNLVVNANNTLFQVVDQYLSFELAALTAAFGPLTIGYDPTDSISVVIAQDNYGATVKTITLANAISIVNFAPNIAYIIQSVITPNTTIQGDIPALLATLNAHNIPIVSSGNIDSNYQLTPYIPVLPSRVITGNAVP